ncbi:hypothetical protein N9R79_12615, partial [Vibrio sp.]|nr:hypothetical protein [Vibrio sp.]
MEKLRHKMMVEEKDSNDRVIKMTQDAFDVVMGIAAASLGPIAATGYYLYLANNTMQSTYSAFETAFDQQGKSIIDQMKRYSEFDVLGQSLLWRERTGFGHLDTMGKAYLKRSLAINGLLRLLLKYKQLERSSGQWNLKLSQIMEQLRSGEMKEHDLDILGYIHTFLLSDDWDIATDWVADFHLDELWLESQGSLSSSSSESFSSYLATANYVTYKFIASDTSDKTLQEAQHYQKYCPIHTISDASLERLYSMIETPDLSDWDDSVYLCERVTARRMTKGEGKEGNVAGPWMPLSDFLDEHHTLTPFDEVKVLVLLDPRHHDVKKVIEDGRVGHVPVSVYPIRQNTFFDDIGPTNTEYVSHIGWSKLNDSEKALVQSKGLSESDDLYGVRVTPTYYFGKNVIKGIKPIAAESTDEMKRYFSGNKDKYAMMYCLEKSIATVDDTKQTIRYPATFSSEQEEKVDEQQYFVLVMKKEHTILAETAFLSAKGQVKATYPELFDDPDVHVLASIPNGKWPSYPQLASAPWASYDADKYKKGWAKELNEFDVWRDPTSLLVVVATKHIEDSESLLSEQGYETGRVPADFVMEYGNTGLINNEKIKVTEEKFLYRVGTVKKEEGGVATFSAHASFDAVLSNKTAPDDIPVKQIAPIVQRFIDNPTAVYDEFAVSGSLPFSDKADTDVYIAELKPDYHNVTGKKIKGLRPILTNAGKSSLAVNVLGLNGSGLNQTSPYVVLPRIS